MGRYVMSSESETWISGIHSAVSYKDKRGLLEYLYYAYSGVWLSATSRYPLGTHIFEKDWDVLVVLDACRVDAIKEVANEYDFIDDVDAIWSLGSTSHEWYAQTFIRNYEKQFSKTALITSNPNAESLLRERDHPPRHITPFLATDWDTITEEDLAYMERTRHHERPFDDISDSAPVSTDIQAPRYITDRGIVAGRKNYEKIILHYFQPHRPFITNLVRQGKPMTYIEDKPYEAIKEGKTTVDEVWPLYLENLRLVLDSVENLLRNIDAEKVAITADHAELIGELGQYGHFQSIPHPKLKKVPWIETTAKDQHIRDPDEEFTIKDGENVNEQLEALGYI